MHISFKNIAHFHLLKHKIKPKTYYDELAELGMLDAYLDESFRTIFETEAEYLSEKYKILYLHSNQISRELEIYLMENLIRSLSFFQEYTKEWRQANQ